MKTDFQNSFTDRLKIHTETALCTIVEISTLPELRC